MCRKYADRSRVCCRTELHSAFLHMRHSNVTCVHDKNKMRRLSRDYMSRSFSETSAQQIQKLVREDLQRSGAVGASTFVPFLKERDSTGKLLSTQPEPSQQKPPLPVRLLSRNSKSRPVLPKKPADKTPDVGQYYTPLNWVKPSFARVSRSRGSTKLSVDLPETKDPPRPQTSYQAKKSKPTVFSKVSLRPKPQRRKGFWEGLKLHGARDILDETKLKKTRQEYLGCVKTAEAIMSLIKLKQ